MTMEWIEKLKSFQKALELQAKEYERRLDGLNGETTSQTQITMDWIDFKSNPPDKPGRYLIYFPEFSTSPMDAIYTRDKKWERDGLDRTEYVTHWMPLPEPPLTK